MLVFCSVFKSKSSFETPKVASTNGWWVNNLKECKVKWTVFKVGIVKLYKKVSRLTLAIDTKEHCSGSKRASDNKKQNLHQHGTKTRYKSKMITSTHTDILYKNRININRHNNHCSSLIVLHVCKIKFNVSNIHIILTLILKINRLTTIQSTS